MDLVVFSKGDPVGANEFARFIALEIISREDAHFCEVSGIGFESFRLPSLTDEILYRLK